MKRFLLASAALALVVVASSAMAANLPVKAVYKAAPVAAWSWTGAYVGGNLGYSWGRSDTTGTFTDGAVLLASFSDNIKLNGAIGGLQIGHNWQNQNWVYGLEADIQLSGQRGSTTAVCPTGVCAAPTGAAALAPGGPVTTTLEQKLRWFGTIRGRIGATVTPTTLAYVTGGLAFGEVKTDGTISGTNGPIVVTPVSGTGTSSTTRLGWTLGGGLEGVLSGKWTGKIEYLYVDLGRVSGSFVTPIVAPSGAFLAAGFSSRVTDNILRVGVNYKF
jgi:outer membrane immunogenic protein